MTRALALLALLLLTACGRATPAPTLPQAETQGREIATEQHPFGLLGIALDPATLTVTSLPSRAAQNGFESANLNPYLTGGLCGDCLRVEAVSRETGGLIGLTLAIRHPMIAGDPALPASSTNRLDLHAYNIEGVLIAPSGIAPTIFPLLNEKAGLDAVRNADGYSANLAPSLLAPLGLTTTVYPYKLFFRDYTGGNFNPTTGYADLQNPRGYHVMPMGIGYDRQMFLLELPATGEQELYFAAQGSWNLAGAPPASQLEPLYRLPEYTKKAASEVRVILTSNDLQPGIPGSSATLQVQLLDTNMGIAAGSGLGDMRFESKVERFDLEIPGLLATRKVVTDPVPVSGDPRSPFNPLKYNLTITNELSAPEGAYLALLRVRDSYPAASTEAPLYGKDVLDGPGVGTDPFANTRALLAYATFAVFSIEVGGSGSCGGAPGFTASSPPDPFLGEPYAYQFTATGGALPHTYTVKSGTLPPGLTLSTSGLLSGQVDSRAAFFLAYPVTIQVSDACAPPANSTVDLTLRVDLRPLTFVYFNVGQGQSTLVYSASGDALIMDVGSSHKPRALVMANYIRSRGLNLKYAIASHFDGDHLGNIGYLISGIDQEPGRKNFDDDNDGESDDYEDTEEYAWPGSDDFMLEKAFDTGNDDLQTQQSDRIWRAAVWHARIPWSTALLGDKTLMDFDEPGLETWFAAGNMAIYGGSNPGRDVADENSNSLSLILRHGAFDTEIGGDFVGANGGGGTNRETELAGVLAGQGIGLDVMLAHHHGSRYSSNTTWLSSMQPEQIIIQCGDGNTYGHPHQELLTRIEGALFGGSPILDQMFWNERGTPDPRTFAGLAVESSPVITIADSDITVVTDGRSYTVTTGSGQMTYPVDLVLP